LFLFKSIVFQKVKACTLATNDKHVI